MPWTPTNDIVSRFGAAIGHDLIPGWTPPNKTLQDAASEVNSGRSALVGEPVIEAVNRYSIAPDLAANLYADLHDSGMVVGVSIGAETSEAPGERTGAGRPKTARLPIEISLVRVLDGQKDIGHAQSGFTPGTAAYDLDRVQDLVMRGLQERSGTLFGGRTLSRENVRRLGEEGFPGWIGRLLEYDVLRDIRNISAT